MGQVSSLQDDASEADMTDVAEERKYFEVKKIFVMLVRTVLGENRARASCRLGHSSSALLMP